MDMDTAETLSKLLSEASSLTDEAKSSIALGTTGKAEEFLSKVSEYLERFAFWSGQMQELGSVAELPEFEILSRDEIRETLSNLQSAHTELINIAEQQRNAVGEAIGEVFRKAKAIHQYIDPFPERVSLTGKRKG